MAPTLIAVLLASGTALLAQNMPADYESVLTSAGVRQNGVFV